MGQSTLTGLPQLAYQELRTSSALAGHKVGAYMETADGRGYRYTKVGATALVPGKLYQAPAEDTSNFQNLTVAVNSVGDTTVTTTSTVTLTANQLAGGLLAVTSATTGAGNMYRIASHPAVTAAVVTFTLDDPITVATTGTVKIDAHPNPYSGVIINPTTISSVAVGVAVHAVAASEWGWLQTHGPCPVLADGANAVGSAVVASNGVAGAVEDAAAPGAQGLQVGACITGAADTEYGLVFLTID